MKLNLKKGLDLSLAGAVSDTGTVIPVKVAECAVCPDDFPGLVPKPEVKEGDKVAVGTPLLRDKNDERVKLVSPAAGTVKAVVRGERRKIMRVVVEIDAASGDAVSFDTAAADRAAAVDLLCLSGMMARIRRRPYDTVPPSAVTPRDIFVTAYDTAPLSPGYVRALSAGKETLERAVALLRLCTDGKVYVSYGSGSGFPALAGAEMVEVSGPHPAGNVGVQIANIMPVNKGETVWGLTVDTLARIGSLLQTGRVDGSTLVALTGSEVKQPCMLATTEGAAIEPLIAGRLADDGRHQRVISGNVLTGTAVAADGFLHYPYTQITVIPEGDDVAEFMGWASLSPKKMSVSRSFPGHFLGKLFKPDARVLGGRRAMIMSGEYDKVLPMDIMSEYLIKAILANDIEGMEKLGIYEVAPEDFALAEYVDTSKLPLQQIIRNGLTNLRHDIE